MRAKLRVIWKTGKQQAGTRKVREGTRARYLSPHILILKRNKRKAFG